MGEIILLANGKNNPALYFCPGYYAFMVRFPLLLMASMVIAGCASPKEDPPRVAGKISVKEKGPLTGGTIQLVPLKGQHGAGIIRADGSYEVLDAPLGECKVVINNEALLRAGGSFITPSEKDGRGPGGLKPGENPGLEKELARTGLGEKVGGEKYIPIDAAYASHETTPLRALIQPGANRLDFEVK
ncbi:MAG: hypothetical protein EXR99_07820 [Gemmataceae bacterium]|nr:hypothetical protein [Gemmataceae bacterium]